MKGTIFFCSIVALVSAKPGGYYHQEYNYKSSSSSFKNNELQHQNEDQGFFSKDGDIDGRSKPKVNSHSQHSEYTNPKLLSGSSAQQLGVGEYNGVHANQANFERLYGSNVNGYRTSGSNGAVDGYAATDRVMDLSNVYTSGSHGSTHGSHGTSMGYGTNSNGYGTNSGGYGTSSGGYGTSSGYGGSSGDYGASSSGHGASSSGYGSSSGYRVSSSDYGTKKNDYGTNLGGYGRTHENYDTSRGGNYGNSLDGTSNFGYTQGESRYGYVQNGGSSGTNANLNSVVQRLQEEMSRQLQNAVNNQHRSSGYTTSVSSSQMTADIRTLEDELKRNLTRQLEERLRSQYGQQELRGSNSYSVIEGRPSTVVNYRNQELADLTGQLENNLLKQLHQNIRTTYNRESTYTSSNNMYQPTYTSSSTYRPTHYERPVIVAAPSNLRFTPIPNPDSITQIASKIQSNINIYLDNALQNIYSTYLQSGRNTYSLTDFDNEVNRIREQIIRNLTWNLDDQIRRNYGQQILKNDHYYSVSASGETSSQHNYNIRDYESLKKQVEENLLKKLNQTVSTYRDQYQRQIQQSYSSNTDYYTVTFRPVYYTSGNQVYDYSDLQRQLSDQLQNALNKHQYSQSSTYSTSTSNNPQAYQISLDELTRELQRNLTEQLNNYRVHSSGSSYGYTSGSSGGNTDFESMKNQLQNQLMQQLQQGLQKQHRYSASASYSASSSSSSNANYGTHQSYGNYANYPNNRYKRDISLYHPTNGRHYSYKSTKSSRSFRTNNQFSSQEQNVGMNFLPHTHDVQPSLFTYPKRTQEDSSETVEDVTNHDQVERPQKLLMTTNNQHSSGLSRHNWRQRFANPGFHHKFNENRFTDQELTEQQLKDDFGQYSGTRDHYGHSQYQGTNEFGVIGHMEPHHSQFEVQEAGVYSNPRIEHLTGQSEDDFTQQLQTINSHKHCKYASNHQLLEQYPQGHSDENIELDNLRNSRQSIYHQHPENLEDQEDLNQQLEQKVSKLENPYPSVQQQTQDDLTLQHQELTEQQAKDDIDQHSRNRVHHGHSQYQVTNEFGVSDHKIPYHSQFPGQETGDFSISNQDIEEKQLRGQSADDFTQQLQTDDSQKHFKSTPNNELLEQNSQQHTTHNIEQKVLRNPKQVTYHQSQETHLEDQSDLTQQQEQEIPKQEQNYPSVQQKIEDISLNQLELKSERNSEISDQQLEDQNKLPKDLKISNSHKLNEGIADNQENQQVEEEPLSKLSNGRLEGSLESQFVQQLDQNQDDLTQQLEEEKLNGPQYPQQIEGQSIADIQTQQVQISNIPKQKDLNQRPLNLQSQEQNDLTLQQIQDVEQSQLTGIRNPENEPQYTQTQDVEQQSETASKKLFDSKKWNAKTEQQELEDQDDLTQQLGLGGSTKPAKPTETDLSQQLELTGNPKPIQQNLISEQQFEDQDNSAQMTLTTERNNKPIYDQSQEQQSEDMGQQLSLSNEPIPAEKNSKNTQYQEATGQREDDFNQETEPERTQNQNKLEHTQNMSTLDQEKTDQEIQKPDNTQEQESDTIKAKNQNQSENDLTQQLELTDSSQTKKIEPIHKQKPLEYDLEQKLDANHSEKPKQLNSESVTRGGKPSENIYDDQLEGQQLEGDLTQQLESDLTQQLESDLTQQSESDLTQQLESDHIRTSSKPNHSAKPIQELENDLDQQLELTGVQKPLKTKNGEVDQQQTQLQFTGTDQTESQLNQQNQEEVFPEVVEPEAILADAKLNHKTLGQKQLAEQHTVHNEQQELLSNENFSPTSEDNFKQTPESSISTQQTSKLIHIAPTTNSSPLGYKKPESNKGTDFHESSSERPFTNSHSGFATSSTTSKNYQEAIRQQDALLNLLKQKIEAQISRNERTFPINGKGSHIPGQMETYGHNHQNIPSRTVSYPGSDVRGTAFHIGDNSQMDSSPFRGTSAGNTLAGNSNSRQFSQDFHRMQDSQFTGKSTRRVIHFSNGKPVSATEYIRIIEPNGKIVESKQEIPLTDDLLRHQFSQKSTAGQLSQNMDNYFQVDGSRTTHHFGQVVGDRQHIPSSEKLFKQSQFSHRIPPEQFSQNIRDYSQLDDIRSTSDNFGQNFNAFGTFGFTGQAKKKTSYYVNGKLVSSSESNQFIGPGGEVIEMNKGSPSAVVSLEQQIADQQDAPVGHKFENISRNSVKTSRYAERIGY